ncbi:MAG: hydroxypyruvate isomerase [Acidobacteria bacterium]|nr:hydroxypyruvate isomerase [Acidobacteriota bacterium]
MPRFSANLTMMFNEVEFTERFAAAAHAGFRAVEYLFPYAYEANRLEDLLAQHGLAQVLFNLPAGDWAAGDRGIACLPGRVGEFRDGIGKAIDYAKVLGCSQVNCLAGILPEGVSAAQARDTFVANAAFAAGELERHGIRLLIEPINTRDMPGFFLNRTRQALDVIAEAGSKNLGLQYDVYHMQIMEGDLAWTIEKNLGIIGHIQIADNPGRHEPGTGEIHYPFLFGLLDRLGYGGWVGCEYKPAGNTEAGLTWFQPYRSS